MTWGVKAAKKYYTYISSALRCKNGKLELSTLALKVYELLMTYPEDYHNVSFKITADLGLPTSYFIEVRKAIDELIEKGLLEVVRCEEYRFTLDRHIEILEKVKKKFKITGN